MAFPFAAAAAVGGLGIGAIQDWRNRAQQWRIYNQNFGQGQQLLNDNRQLGEASFWPGLEYLNNIIGNGGGNLYGLNPQQQSLMQQIMGSGFQDPSTINNLFQDAGQFLNPINFSPTNRTVVDAANQDVFNRGRTDATTIGFDRANDLFAASVAGTAPAAQAGLDIILGGGRTPQSQQVSQAMLDLISSGGRTPENRQALAQGNNLISSGGMTPALRDIQSQLQALIQGGGLSAEGRELFRELMPLIESGGEGGALMPFNNALSFARDAAATASMQQAEAARRNALQRGAAPGSVVASGLQNRALADFGDASAQNEARALREAAAAQQGLQLQQFLGTQGTLANLLGQAQSIRGQAVGGLGNVASATAANLATGGRLVDTGLANQLGTLQSGIQGFGQNFANENQRLGLGNSIFGNALSQYGNLQNIAFQGLLGSESQRASNQQNAIAALLGISDQGITARGQNLNAAAQQGSLLNQQGQMDIQTYGQLLDLLSSGQANQMGAANSMFSTGSQIYGNNASIFGAMAGVPIPQSGPSPFTTWGLGAASDINWGSLFGNNQNSGSNTATVNFPYIDTGDTTTAAFPYLS